MKTTTKFYAAVRTQARGPRAAWLRGKGGSSKVYKNGWAYLHTKPVTTCKAAKKSMVSLKKKLKQLGLTGAVGLMARTGQAEKRLRKCPLKKR